MTNLECSVKNCNYNRDKKCCLDSIKVRGMEATSSKGTACGSFRDRECCGIEHACEFACEPASKSVIECDAVKCVHNYNKKCNAKCIDIEGKNATVFEDTCCETFEMR